MRTLVKFLIFLVVLGGVAAAAYYPVSRWMAARGRTNYETEKADRGRVEFIVNSTGKLEPVQSVTIGSFVSGPIIEINVDFNSEVKKGDVLAKVDPRIYKANEQREKAALESMKAELLRVEAQLAQARNDERRAMTLRERNEDYISQTEIDKFRFGREALEAQLVVANAAILQAQASYENARANLDYTIITAPVDGIVIDCKMRPGQTIASQFQTPELFIVALNMRETMHVVASVDEADIGFIRDAQKKDMPVTFTVDAYPEDKFEGHIHQVRMNSTVDQTVVTYPVIIAAPNPDLKLIPSMTAHIEFHVDVREDVLRVPNTALRFFPDPAKVRPEDRKLVDLSSEEADRTTVDKSDFNLRHVWVKEGEFLRAIEVRTGVTDATYTEILEGDLVEGQEVVTNLQVGPAARNGAGSGGG